MKYYIYDSHYVSSERVWHSFSHTWSDGTKDEFERPTTICLFNKLGEYEFFGNCTLASGVNYDCHMIAKSTATYEFNEEDKTCSCNIDVEACDDLVTVDTWYIPHVEFETDSLEEALNRFVDYVYDIKKYNKDER